MDGFNSVSTLDRLKVMDRMASYSWALDSGNVEAYLDCFTADAVLRHPKRDGSPGEFVGEAGIRSFVEPGFAQRPTQTYGHQHHFNAIRLSAEGDDIRVAAYAIIFRHEFHRQYWPRGSSWRMGTWHTLMRAVGDTWKIADVDVRMWNDTAFDTGTALLDRGPGMPGVRD